MHEGPVTRQELELLALGDLPTERAKALKRQANTDETLATRMQRVAYEIAVASEGLPPLGLRQGRQSTWGRSWQPWAIGVVAAAAAVLLLVAALRPVPDETLRGPFDLHVTQVRLGQAWEAGALVHARPGDHLQFKVYAPDGGWLSIIDVEDSGEVGAFLQPLALDVGAEHTAAVKLDDYQGGERVFVLVGDRPVTAEDVREAVYRAHRTPLAELDQLPGIAASQRSVWIVKEAP